jgi:dihydrofolate synthase/folylpolyglutamate synthase
MGFMNTPPGPDTILERLLRLHPKLIDLSLGRIERLLAALGNSHHRLPPVIHVAGTNGKGSVVAFLEAMLTAAGYRAHTYTSPHLTRFNERIRLAGRDIDDDALTALLEECEVANAGLPITFFEITTAAAFLAFTRTPADILLLEAGLGGRLDATNVIDRPAVTGITPVSVDHVHFLGETIEAVAGEKAGILKPGVAAVIGPQTDTAAAVMIARAAALGAPLYRHGHGWQVRTNRTGFRFDGQSWRFDLPAPALPGRHQIDNAGIAIACLERLDGFAITADAIANGLKQVKWPARLQRLTRGPLVAALLNGWELWLDGGHNPAAGAALAEAVTDWRDRPLYLIFGNLDTKDRIGFLEPLGAAAAALRGITIPGEAAALSARDAAAAGQSAGIDSAPSESVGAALAELTAMPGPARVLICGSLYLAGRVLRENG